MSILAFLLVVIAVGVLVWAAEKWAPMSAPIKKALPYFAIAILVILLLVLVGLLPLHLGALNWSVPRAIQ